MFTALFYTHRIPELVTVMHLFNTLCQRLRGPVPSRGKILKPLRASLTALALLWLPLPAMATTVLGMDIDQLVADAELIFEGEVIQRQSRQDQATGLINTYVTFRVRDVIKGNDPGAMLELRFTGGSVNGQIVEISGLIIPGAGEQGIYFVESMNADMLNPLLGWSQGHYLIFDDNGERRVSTVDNKPVIDVQPVAAIPRAIKKPQAIGGGDNEVAAGVMTESSALSIERALSVDEFKARIQSIIGN